MTAENPSSQEESYTWLYVLSAIILGKYLIYLYPIYKQKTRKQGLRVLKDSLLADKMIEALTCYYNNDIKTVTLGNESSDGGDKCLILSDVHEKLDLSQEKLAEKLQIKSDYLLITFKYNEMSYRDENKKIVERAFPAYANEEKYCLRSEYTDEVIDHCFNYCMVGKWEQKFHSCTWLEFLFSPIRFWKAIFCKSNKHQIKFEATAKQK
jgi:hypothetical protein